MRKSKNDLLKISIFSMIVFLGTFFVVATSRSKAESLSPYKTSVWGIVINKDSGSSVKSGDFFSPDRKRWALRKLDNTGNFQEAHDKENNSFGNTYWRNKLKAAPSQRSSLKKAR